MLDRSRSNTATPFSSQTVISPSIMQDPVLRAATAFTTSA
jgi:hypothetical protein